MVKKGNLAKHSNTHANTHSNTHANMTIRGAIDVGSSSIKLLISGVSNVNNVSTIVEQIYFATYVTKLGAGLNKTGRLSKRSVDKSLEAFRTIAELLQYHNCKLENTRTVATAALRNAHDANRFIDLVYTETGIKIDVISPEDEALYTANGIISFIPEMFASGIKNIIVDIGGGSTEFTSTVGNHFKETTSRHIGSVQLSNIFNMHEHYKTFPLDKVQQYIEQELSSLYASEMFSNKPHNLVVTAGTIATITSIYKRGTHNHHQATHLEVSDIEGIFQKILRTQYSKRTKIPGLAPGKQDTALAGCILLLNIVKHLGISQVVYSPCGLKEGLVVSP